MNSLIPQSWSARKQFFLFLSLLIVGFPLFAAPGIPAEDPRAAQEPAREEDPGFASLKGSAFPVAENAGMVTVVVRRHRGTFGAVSIHYETADGTAEAGADYESTSGVLEWADGERKDKSFTVVILDDDEEEGQEIFGILLSEATGGLSLTEPTSAVVRIKPSDRDEDEGDDDEGGDDDGDDDGDDEDDSAGTLKLTKDNYPVFESAGLAFFTVERDDGTEGAVSVEYMTFDGSATDGEDYSGVSGVLSWADGEGGEKSVAFDVFDDIEPEDTETVTVVLTNASGGASLGSRDTSSIQIIDNDGVGGDCIPDEVTLCLGDGRFQVTGSWTDFDANTGPFMMVPGTDDTGFAWFFDEDNLEVLIKVLNGCPINGYYWVFFAATTNVGFEIEVTDLLSGDVRNYSNPVGVSPETTTDTTAFPTCSE